MTDTTVRSVPDTADAVLVDAWQALAAKISGTPQPGHATYAQFTDEVKKLMVALAQSEEFHAGSAVRAAFAKVRERVAFMQRDRAMDQDVQRVCELVASQTFSTAG